MISTTRYRHEIQRDGFTVNKRKNPLQCEHDTSSGFQHSFRASMVQKMQRYFSSEPKSDTIGANRSISSKKSFIERMLGAIFFMALFMSARAAGPSQIPVLGYHQLGNAASYYSSPTATFTWQMNQLKALGYQTITPQQYVNWLQGDASTLPPKPVLVTFDDNIANALPAVAIMQSVGMAGVMYVVSGFADAPDGWNMDWTQLASLKASGWTIQLHAGPLGHALMAQSPNCPYFNGCRLPNEPLATYQARVASDLDQGIAKLQQYNFITGNSVTYALPFDFYGQGTTDTAVAGWFPGNVLHLKISTV